MKTNFLKSIVLFAALSLAFTACQKDSLVTEVETGMEKKKVDVEQIRPIEPKNDRDLDRDLLKELPVRKEVNTPDNTPVNKKRDLNLLKEIKAR